MHRVGQRPPYDVLVVGAGITGLAAAKYAAEQHISVACVEGMMLGGLVVNVNELDPAPPAIAGSGADFAVTLMSEGSDLGVESIDAAITAIERDGELLAAAAGTDFYRARSIIVATGARLKRLGIPSEAKFEGRGVSQCADCDGPFYKGADVVVVGGGDSALQEALVLATYCRSVVIVHRDERFSAQAHFVEAVLARENIVVRWKTIATEVFGTETVSGVGLQNVDDGSTERLDCKGFFAYVGLTPNAEFLIGRVECDANGFVKTDASFQTSLPGVFAAGAVRAGFGGLLTNAIADARLAAGAAAAYARGQKREG